MIRIRIVITGSTASMLEKAASSKDVSVDDLVSQLILDHLAELAAQDK